ncbi:MAG: galactose mutarotase [Candidatus Pseudobacter hemicellulosilyticus]|uniref:Aldose 1-epimerase n=1 Tax=Candidatus Pseudobacter hemicellulosilyticus TaxID=3121375 RepID=A0AAJ5WRZ1_9BACT|nr:MAG: galactose mutarotase [Pseudobacter sp.]
MKRLNQSLAVIALLAFAACNQQDRSTSTHLPSAAGFTDTIGGKTTSMVVIKNAHGIEAAFTTYGARLVSLVVPDKNGKPTPVVIGFDSARQYKESTEPYFSATVGRYGNRIKNGQFTLDSVPYQLTINNGPNTLHGGVSGFQDKVWDVASSNDSSIVFTYLSKDGEEGFPGNAQIKVTYSLTDDNGLKMEYEATTDKPTVMNLTNHAFFNLNGEGSGSILEHTLWIDADQYTPVDSTLIPTGVIAPVAGTPFDFNTPTTIGQRINEADTQLNYGKGYDHNYVLKGSGWHKAATATGDKSGIVLEVWTEEPGVQFYSGNFMQSKNTLRGGVKDDLRTAFCLETQHYPDSPNQPAFPSTVLRPGQTYKTVSMYRFDVKK